MFHEADQAQFVGLVAQPTAWFVFGATFFRAVGIPLYSELLLHSYELSSAEQAKATLLVLLPVAAFSIIFVAFPITRGTFVRPWHVPSMIPLSLSGSLTVSVFGLSSFF